MTTLNAQKIHLYFGARKTSLEMLKDRHYNVPEYLFSLTEKQFGSETEKYFKISGITDNRGIPVYIKLYEGGDKSSLFADILDFLRSQLPETDIPIGKDDETIVKNIKNIRLFIIYDSTGVAQNLARLNETYIGDPNREASFIEAFDVNFMYINPTKHVYQPKWRLMSEAEITEVMQRYEDKSAHLTRSLFASVCIDDPINRYYGGKPPSKDGKGGDMYEIIRDGVNVFYRKVSSKKMNFGKN